MPTTSYTILIKDSTGDFAEHPTICDGSSSFSMANNYCYIQMSQLRSTPISLSQGQLIQAKVIATNFNGSSAQSLANASGTLVQTEPSQVALPTQGSATSHL